MVEGARLESVYTGNCIKGSNPFLSASKKYLQKRFMTAFAGFFVFWKSFLVYTPFLLILWGRGDI